MNEAELKNIWKNYDRKIENLLQINKQQLQAIQSEKAYGRIRSFKRNHIVVMLLGVVWVLFLAVLFRFAPNPFFMISVGMILLFNVFAVGLYLYHLILLSRIDISKSITATQAQLVKVAASYVHVGRILLLQTPFYCTWWYNDDLVQHGGAFFWIINLGIVVALTLLAVWVFVKLSPKQKPDKWTKLFDNWFGAQKLYQANKFLEEIEEYKHE